MILNKKMTSSLAKKWQLLKTAVMRCFYKIKYFFRNRKYDVYCPYCSSCGESGCCSPTSCINHKKGMYCYSNQGKLKVAYWSINDLSLWLLNSENETITKGEVYQKIRELKEENWKGYASENNA